MRLIKRNICSIIIKNKVPMERMMRYNLWRKLIYGYQTAKGIKRSTEQ